MNTPYITAEYATARNKLNEVKESFYKGNATQKEVDVAFDAVVSESKKCKSPYIQH